MFSVACRIWSVLVIGRDTDKLIFAAYESTNKHTFAHTFYTVVTR